MLVTHFYRLRAHIMLKNICLDFGVFEKKRVIFSKPLVTLLE
jgi:hypothetical protein